MTEYLVAVSFELWMVLFLALHNVVAEIVLCICGKRAHHLKGGC